MTTIDTGDRLWTPDDVSAYLSIPVATLYRWRSRGEGPAGFRVGKHVRYDPLTVRRWLESRADSVR